MSDFLFVSNFVLVSLLISSVGSRHFLSKPKFWLTCVRLLVCRGYAFLIYLQDNWVSVLVANLRSTLILNLWKYPLVEWFLQVNEISVIALSPPLLAIALTDNSIISILDPEVVPLLQN